MIVFDGFPQAMRKHASTIDRASFASSCGFYLMQEVNMLSNLLENPARPFTVIIGGAKISDKVYAVNNIKNSRQSFSGRSGGKCFKGTGLQTRRFFY